MTFPHGKKFAFTIFDDCDFGSVNNMSPVYSFLYDKGFLTTKSVWTLKGEIEPIVGGSTCAEPDYLNWVRILEKQGFEIASHGATYHTAEREMTIKGYEKFYELFGKNPDTYAAHQGCAEGIYNGKFRVSGVNRLIYNLATRFRYDKKYRGHIDNEKVFWGDICKEKIKYVRSFVFKDMNTLKQCPYMPYHDPSKPYVNYWFCSSEGAEVNSFNNTISENKQDRLEAEGGVCIMYTHLACGFYANGQLNERFSFLMDRLSKKNGWFVPVNQLLDYLIKVNGRKVITPSERKHLERKWLLNKFSTGAT
jgi:hypothetical protein